MDSLPKFLHMEIARAPSHPTNGQVTMRIILRQAYHSRESKLRRAFGGEERLSVLLDRPSRHGRTHMQPVAVERRCADQRRPEEELLEVVISF